MSHKTLFKLKSKADSQSEIQWVRAISLESAQECIQGEVEVLIPSWVDRIRASRKATLQELSVFFKNFYRFLRTGTPIIDAIHICAIITRGAASKGILCEIAHKMRTRGLSMAQVIEQDYAAVFGNATVAIIKSAEISGKNEEVFKMLGQRAEDARKLSKQLKAAAAYPLAMLAFAIAAMFGMLLGIIPRMASTFQDANLQLPAITKVCLAASSAIQNNLWVLAGFIVIFVLLGSLIKKHRDATWIQRIILSIPLVSGLIGTLSLLDAFRTISLLIRSGSDLVETHLVAVNTTRLKVHQEYFSTIAQLIRLGKSPTEAYRACASRIGLKGQEASMMVQVGTASGALGEVLQDFTANLFEEAQSQAQQLPKALQPVLLLLIFAVIGVCAAAIYLPQFQIVLQVINME